MKGVRRLKRLALWLLCVCLLCVPVRAGENEKLVALTFDDGPSGRFTRRLLDGLEERGVQATFLLCGYRMEQYPELAERIYRQGHEIGIHGYSHRSMGKMSSGDVIREIDRTVNLLPEGCRVFFLRPPGGACGKYVLKAAEERGLGVLSWSVDPRDWATHDSKAIEKAVVSHVRDGDVILLHDMSDSSVDAALVIIDELQEQGFRFVTVSALAEEREIPIEPGAEYTRFP